MASPRSARRLDPVASGLAACIALVYGCDFWFHGTAAYRHLPLLLVTQVIYLDRGWKYGVPLNRMMLEGTRDDYRRTGLGEEEIQRRFASSGRRNLDLALSLALGAETVAFAFTGHYGVLLRLVPQFFMWFFLVLGALMAGTTIFAIVAALRRKV